MRLCKSCFAVICCFFALGDSTCVTLVDFVVFGKTGKVTQNTSITLNAQKRKAVLSAFLRLTYE